MESAAGTSEFDLARKAAHPGSSNSSTRGNGMGGLMTPRFTLFRPAQLRPLARVLLDSLGQAGALSLLWPPLAPPPSR